MSEKKKLFHTEAGVTHFTKRTERILFFILTLAMLGWGAADKITSLIK